MVKSLIFIFQVIFFVIMIVASLILLIITMRNADNDYDYDKIRAMLDEQSKQNLKKLSEMNKRKNEIEKSIREKKKILGFNLVSGDGKYE